MFGYIDKEEYGFRDAEYSAPVPGYGLSKSQTVVKSGTYRKMKIHSWGVSIRAHALNIRFCVIRTSILPPVYATHRNGFAFSPTNLVCLARQEDRKEAILHIRCIDVGSYIPLFDNSCYRSCIFALISSNGSTYFMDQL